MLSSRRAHATIPTADLGRARAFYEGVLGFVPRAVLETAVLYDAGDGSVFAVSRGSGAASGTHTQMAFTSPAIDADVAALRASGIVFEEYDFPTLRTVDGIAALGSSRAAWFKDPEGNILALIEFADAV